MGKSRWFIRDKKLLDEFENCKKIILEKTRDLNSYVEIKIRTSECRLLEDNSNSSRNGYYDHSDNFVVMSPRVVAFTPERREKFLLHELCHLVQGITAPRSRAHGKEFKNLCAYIGYPEIGMARSTSVESDYEDKDFYRRAKEGRVGSSRPYKYEITCPECGNIIGRTKTRSKIIKNPEAFHSTCCKATLNKNCIKEL